MKDDFSKGTGALKLTLIRFFLAPLFLFFYTNQSFMFYQGQTSADLLSPVSAGIVCIIILILAMLSDFFDGRIARKYGQVSDLGKILDPLSDAFFFLVFYTTLCCVSPYWMPFWLLIPIFVREFVQHIFIRTYALKKGVALAATWSAKIKMVLSCFGSLYVLIINLTARVDDYQLGSEPDFMKISVY